MRRDRRTVVDVSLVLVFAVAAVTSAAQHDWQAAVTFAAIIALRLLLWGFASERLRPRANLDSFRLDAITDEPKRGMPLDPERLGPIMIAVVLGWTAAVFIIGDVVLHAQSWTVIVGIVAVLPLSLGAAMLLVRRLPPHLR
jgi:hypothetical protein